MAEEVKLTAQQEEVMTDFEMMIDDLIDDPEYGYVAGFILDTMKRLILVSTLLINESYTVEQIVADEDFKKEKSLVDYGINGWRMKVLVPYIKEFGFDFVNDTLRFLFPLYEEKWAKKKAEEENNAEN